MTTWMSRLLTLVAFLATGAHAADGLDDPAERARIRSERAAAESSLLARERECRSRFVVTSCVDAARREHRDILARLRSEEEVLDDSRRKQRAAQRAEAIREKVRRDEAREREAASPERREANRKATAPHVTVRKPEAPAAEARLPSPVRSPAASVPAADRRSAEARSQAEFDARAQAAQAHRESVDRRNAERAAKGKTGAPLPSPSPPP